MGGGGGEGIGSGRGRRVKGESIEGEGAAKVLGAFSFRSCFSCCHSARSFSVAISLRA